MLNRIKLGVSGMEVSDFTVRSKPTVFRLFQRHHCIDAVTQQNTGSSSSTWLSLYQDTMTLPVTDTQSHIPAKIFCNQKRVILLFI